VVGYVACRQTGHDKWCSFRFGAVPRCGLYFRYPAVTITGIRFSGWMAMVLFPALFFHYGYLALRVRDTSGAQAGMCVKHYEAAKKAEEQKYQCS